MATTYDFDRAGGLTRAEIAIRCMIEALSSFTENEYIDLREPYEVQLPKTWPSTLAYVEANCNGFYGVTVFAAEKGAGKSMILTASAIEAAASGEWQVVHFVAEDDYDGLRERFNLNLAAHPGLGDCYSNYHVFSVGKGQTPQSICAEVVTAVDTSIDTPILVCMDSVNSIVNLSGERYLEALSSFGLWAMFSRRTSRGDVSFMLTTESNKRGESKGETLPFWSDCYVKMKKKSDNVVEMYLDKTRRTGGEGPMGKHVRHWMLQRFYRHTETPELRIVNGGIDPDGDYELL